MARPKAGTHRRKAGGVALLAEFTPQVGFFRALQATADDPVCDAIGVGSFHGFVSPIMWPSPMKVSQGYRSKIDDSKGYGSYPAEFLKWQAARWPSATASRAGTSLTQRSAFIGQRGLK